MNTSIPFDGFEAGAATLICCSQKLLLIFDESSQRYTVPTCPLTGRELSHADDEPWRAAAARAVQECVDGRIPAAPELIAELNIDGRPCQVFQLFVLPRDNFKREWMGIEPTKRLCRRFAGFEDRGGHQIRVHSRGLSYSGFLRSE